MDDYLEDSDGMGEDDEEDDLDVSTYLQALHHNASHELFSIQHYEEVEGMVSL